MKSCKVVRNPIGTKLLLSCVLFVIPVVAFFGLPRDRDVVLASQMERVPGGTAEDSFLALHHPDRYAWQLFLAISRQADPIYRGKADPRKASLRHYDDDKPVVWETWAMVSGGRMGPLRNVPNTSEVYLDRGARPVPWTQLPAVSKSVEPIAVKQLAALMDEFATYPRLIQVRNGTLETLQPDAPQLQLDPKLNPPNEVLEIRMNRAAYEYIAVNNLYSIEGLEQKFREGNRIYFPLGGQEVKAIWTRIEEKDKSRYHWRRIERAGSKELYGLTDLHIMTHDLPNWFWANFVHVDYADNPTGTSASPAEGGVYPATKGSKWVYYRLGGTQRSFTDERGKPTLLSGMQLERDFRGSSSCVTCHARATVGLRSARPDGPQDRPNVLAVFLTIRPKPVGAIGAPDPAWFLNAQGQTAFIQTDFVYTAPVRALSTADVPPNATSARSNHPRATLGRLPVTTD